ncbi:MAG: glycoside hydrolase 5 family protein [Vulcanimicrobiaceae bacterium]
MPPFLLGINYWPRRSALSWWERFDLNEMCDDFAQIAALGFDVVRFFLRWESFQPSPEQIDAGALAHFEQVMTALDEAGLRGMPTLFCGHMSGVNWLPEWTLDPGTPAGRFRTISGGRERTCGIGDFYADPNLLSAQERLARALGERVRAHPALLGWDLGNEFSNLRQPTSAADAAGWSARLSCALEESSARPVSAGTHGEDLSQDRNLRLSSLCAPFAYATMHGYPVYSSFARNRLDPNVVPFLAELASACAGKPVLFTELGNPGAPRGTVSPGDRVPLPGEAPLRADALPKNAAPYACATDEEMARYAHETIARLHARGALGAFWWCFADYARDLADQPPFDRAPHELHFGIVDADGNAKPVAQALRRFAQEQRRVVAAPPPLVDEATYYTALPQGLEGLYRGYCALYP